MNITSAGRLHRKRSDPARPFEIVLTEKKILSENRKLVRVAVNVMRARLTVIGFNIAIV
jgi:hypothetical protein